MKRRTLLKGLASLGVLGAAGTAAAQWRGNAYYRGPASDHFDGTKFFNPGGEEPRGLRDLLRWQMEARSAWPGAYPGAVADVPPPRVEGAKMRLSYVGHASFLLQTAGLNLLLDPVWSERASPFSFAGPRRVNPPGIAFEALPSVDAVLVSHNHYDHMDVVTLARIAAAHRPVLISPLGNDAIMRKHVGALPLKVGDWGDTIEIAADMRVHLVPAQHWSARGMRDRSHALWCGFVLETPAATIYFAGDTGFGSGDNFRRLRERFPAIRLALLPIGAYEPRWFMRGQHMNPAEAVEAFQLTGAQQAVAYHWGTFQLTNEAVDAPPRELAAALAERRLPADAFKVLRPGEVWSA